MTNINDVIRTRRLIFVLGPGGVGKTSLSTAIAIAAAKEGHTVALVSIDPAKRLADALGLKLGKDLEQVKNLGAEVTGDLWATMLDQKQLFDEAVETFTMDPAVQKRIYALPIYQAVSAKMGSALEYLALLKIQQILDSSRFDRIIIDTPPDVHALDFLSRPNILAGFFDNKVMQWIVKPIILAQKFGLSRLVMAAEKFNIAGIAKITGINALTSLADFFTLMNDTITGIHRVGQKLSKVMSGSETGFLVVAQMREKPLLAANFVIDELVKANKTIDLLLINRVPPKKLLDLAAAYDLSTELPASYDSLPLKGLVQRFRSFAENYENCQDRYRGIIPIQGVAELPTAVEPLEAVKMLSTFLNFDSLKKSV